MRNAFLSCLLLASVTRPILAEDAKESAPPKPASAPAPDPGAAVPATAERPVDPAPPTDNPIASRVIEMSAAGKTLDATRFLDSLRHPKPEPVRWAPVSTRPLSGREVARRASDAYLRVGWVYQCKRCSRWHSDLAGGYAVAKDTVATAHHVLDPPKTMRAENGWPVVLRGEMDVLPIVAVLAADPASDAAILRLGVNNLHPVGLSADVEPGDHVFCLSDPGGNRGMFTSGIVNRLTTVPHGSQQKPADRRLNVGVDWAPGSSGAAVLDACGNAIGHVGSVTSLFANESKKSGDSKDAGNAPPPVMTLHIAIPASTVRALLEKPRE